MPTRAELPSILRCTCGGVFRKEQFIRIPQRGIWLAKCGCGNESAYDLKHPFFCSDQQLSLTDPLTTLQVTPQVTSLKGEPTAPVQIDARGDHRIGQPPTEQKKEKAPVSQKQKESRFIENTAECEYDCDAQECIATGCERYGLCIFTQIKAIKKEAPLSKEEKKYDCKVCRTKIEKEQAVESYTKHGRAMCKSCEKKE